VICFCKHGILEIRIGIKIELQLETVRIVKFTPLDIFEILEGLLVMFSDLSHKKKEVTYMQSLKDGSYATHIQKL
jgi:hypothetical protein